MQSQDTVWVDMRYQLAGWIGTVVLIAWCCVGIAGCAGNGDAVQADTAQALRGWQDARDMRLRPQQVERPERPERD